MSSLLDDDAKLAFEAREALRRDFEEADVEQKAIENPISGVVECVPVVSFGKYFNHTLVGHGRVTKPNCGRFKTYVGCLGEDGKGHDVVTLEGKDYRGLGYVKKVFCTCHKPSCPVCYGDGWANREAKSIEARLRYLSETYGELRMKQLGKIEHIVVAPESCSYDSIRDHYDVERKRVVEALFECGVAGAAVIFHGFRFDDRKRPFWNPHFHVLGFISGGYQCRGCKKWCGNCNGFEARVRQLRLKNHMIVKVAEDRLTGEKGERKSIWSTARYQLGHASIRTDVAHPRAVTWFGVVSYRKLRVPPSFVRKFVRDKCPICGRELVRLRFNGAVVFDAGFKLNRVEFPVVVVDGFEMWEKDNSKAYGYG